MITRKIFVVLSIFMFLLAETQPTQAAAKSVSDSTQPAAVKTSKIQPSHRRDDGPNSRHMFDIIGDNSAVHEDLHVTDLDLPTENSMNATNPFFGWKARIATHVTAKSTQLGSQPSPAAAFTSCAAVTQIPTTECDALVALYNSTNGASWMHNTDWLQTDTPCSWYAVTCASGTHVTKLDFFNPNDVDANMTPLGNNMSGAIPTQIGNLTYLEYLDLRFNPLSGSIPAEIGNLINLTTLCLGYTQLSGAIPTQISNLTNLTVLVMSGTQLSGTIPTQIGNLTNLTSLGLDNTQLSGTIPTQIGNLTSLTALYLNDTQLSGSLPTEVGNLTNLTTLWLYNSQLTGEIPASFANLTNLSATDTSLACGLTSTNSTVINFLNGLLGLNWDVNCPAPFTTCAAVTQIPTTECDALVDLYYSTEGAHWTNNTNWLQVDTPCSWEGVNCAAGTLIVRTTVGGLYLSYHNLIGAIPSTIDKLTNLVTLDLQHNLLNGIIPPQLGNLSHLTILRLNCNWGLIGPIPPELGNLTNLAELNFQSNQLTGPIPTELGKLTKLRLLNLNDNDLSGTIPPGLMNLTQLRTLYLGLNSVAGEVPSTITNLTLLQIQALDLPCGATSTDTAVISFVALKMASPNWNTAGCQKMYYVQPNVTGTEDCLSWATACDFDVAMSAATKGATIWFKAGTYKMSKGFSFHLKNGVAMYGGFAGTETQLSQRNPLANPTILTGDPLGDDVGITNNADNAYHVVNGSYTDATAILDGFTITNGNASGPNWPDYNGGGMINYKGGPTLRNLTFTNNYASNGGGGLINDANSGLVLVNTTFVGNSAGAAGGGGMLNWGASNLTLANVTFSNNTTTGPGGGLVNYSSSQVLTNGTFSDNSAANGGGINNAGGSVTVTNTIIANSTAGGDCIGTLTSASNNLIEDGSNACGLTNGVNGNIIGQDPNLGALANNGGATQTMALGAGNPAIDAGTNTGCPANDQRGVYRPQNGTCDIGAFEFDVAPKVMSITRVNPNPTAKASVQFTVTFSESVTGISAADFSLTKTGITGGSIIGVAGSGVTRTVAVNTGSGNGTLRLDIPNTATITDMTGNPVTNIPFSTGQTYTINKILTYVSQAANDGWILEAGENTNLGGSLDATNANIRLGDDPAKKQYRGILSFNTSSLPDNATVSKVTLKIKQNGAAFGGGNPVSIFQGFVVDVKNGFFNTAGLTTSDFNAAPSKVYGPFTTALSGGWYNIVLTNPDAYINKSTTNGGGLTQIRLRFKLDDNNDTAANYINLFSGNATIASDRPQLIIEYSVP